jgi:hypothetical protein
MSCIPRRLEQMLGYGRGPDHARAAARLEAEFGVRVVEHDPKGNARPLRPAELAILTGTLELLGPRFYGPFLREPLHLWVDRNPGGGGYGNKWLRIGEPGGDVSILYRIFLHEATHASNEYRGWPYELKWCTLPGLDWRKDPAGNWVHPRQQGRRPEPGEWETLPVDSRDVSTAPGEDLAEAVRYFVHSVKGERAWLWPLDRAKVPLYLWDASPTRFVLVRDFFLGLPEGHPWHRPLSPDQETRAAANLASAQPG